MAHQQYTLKEQNYRPKFSGHETFALRYGWLKKAFDAVETGAKTKNAQNVFLRDDAIAKFGVGKNMVASIRYWAEAAGIISDGGAQTTPLGELLFQDRGLDPYMEYPTSIWLVHWLLASDCSRTTWHWAFSYYSDVSCDIDSMQKGLERLVRENNWPQVSPVSLKKDLECFFHTYTTRVDKGSKEIEHHLVSPLTELGLLKFLGNRKYRFIRGPKPSLGNGMFLYALEDFWQRYFSDVATLSFESLAHDPGSPGRLFLLDEDSLMDRLVQLSDLTKGKIIWSETAGLRQVQRKGKLPTQGKLLSYLELDYLDGDAV